MEAGLKEGGVTERAKRYSSLKYSLALLDTAYLIALLFLFQGLGLSKILADKLANSLPGLLILPVYMAIASLAYYLLNLPLNFYQSFALEHKFSLSNQKISGWALDQVKGGVISYLLALILIGAFYYILAKYPAAWWLIISALWIIFSVVFAKLLPIVIIPLFFKYKRLTDEALRTRILNLAEKMRVKILDCFEIDFSKKTLKANAAFVGMGRTKRVILADTLKDKYTHDEIEVILAHEFSHYKLRHLLKLVFLNALSIIASFYLIFRTSAPVLKAFGLSTLSDLGALPIVILYFVLFGMITQPLNNFISRCLERNADKLALATTDFKDAFISTMEKLSLQNLADRSPHPVIKFFFFDHPPIDERINQAKLFR